MKLIATNRKARRDYSVTDTFEAGIVLQGCEVKSLRGKSCSLDESFARIEGGEMLLYNMHIAEFKQSSYFTPEPKRKRKLLLHKSEIKKLLGQTAQRGFSLIPLRVYFNERGVAKVEIALAKGRNIVDKRKKLKDDATKRDIESEMRRAHKGR